jgi:predicted flavoprotein YhiN
VYEITKEEKPIFELNGDGGATYEANEKRIRDILNLFKNHKGEVSLDFLPARAKKIIRELQQENKDIRKQAIKNDKTKKLKKQWVAYYKAYGKVRKKYVVTKKTDEYLARHANDAQLGSFDLIQ